MIRKATVEDIQAIHEMAEVVFRETYKTILSPGQMEYMMEMMYSIPSLTRQMTYEKQTFFIDDGNGYVSCRPDGQMEDGRSRYHLEKLYVMPHCQKTGLGKMLFETVCEYLKSISPGKLRIELNVNRNNPAVSFYEHLGMFKARQGDFPIGNNYYMNDYIMATDL